MTTHETRPGPSPNHPPLHANYSAFLRNAEILFYVARGYEQRRQTFHSSISNLNLNLNSKAHVWDWTSELCLSTTIALTVIQYIQSYITYITYDRITLHTLRKFIHYIHYIQSYITSITYNRKLHTLHTNANHTICRNLSQPSILTTHSSNMIVTQQLYNNSQP